MKKKKYIIIGTLIIIVMAIGFRLKGNKAKINESNKVIDRSGIAIPVTTMSVERISTQMQFSLPAKTEPVNSANLTINSAGKLVDLDFELGTEVSKGQRIGGVDVTQKQLNLEASQLLVNKYERDYKNFKDLFEQNAASENDYKNAQYNYENAKAQVALINQQIADASIISPISGVIVSKNMEKGEFVNAGTAVGEVVDISTLKATVMASESEVYKLHKGMAVKISSEVFPEHKFEGKLRFVSPQGDQNHNYPAEIIIQNDNNSMLKAGTFVRVEFDINDTAEILSIPKNALVEGIKNPYVYLAKDNRAKARTLVLGSESGEYIEVKEGLSEGDQVILSGQINLSDSSLIEILSNN